MPADAWHQPDSIENKKKIVPKKKEKTISDDSDDVEPHQYYLADEKVPIHRLNDDCLIHIFLYLPIVDKVNIESGKKLIKYNSVVENFNLVEILINKNPW